MILDIYKIKKLKNIFSGRRIFLIGNGPSVRYEDLELLSDEVSFCANRFYLCYPKINFRPTLTFVEDKQVIENHFDEIASSCETSLIVPSRFVANKKKHYTNLIRYSFLEQKTESFVTEFSFDFEVGLYSGATVMFGMLQVALYTGAKEIIFYGMDHNFKIPTNSLEYNKKLVVDSGEKNHFLENYRKPGEVWFAPQTKKINQGFELAKSCLEKRKIKVFNATRGGKLELFERKKFDSFFAKKIYHRFFKLIKRENENITKKILIRIKCGTHFFSDLDKSLIRLFENLNNSSHKISIESSEDESWLHSKGLSFKKFNRLSSRQEKKYDQYDLVLNCGDPRELIIDHKASYFFINGDLSLLCRTPTHNGVSLNNYDVLHAFDYYDGLVVSSKNQESALRSLGVKRSLYTL